MANESNSNAGKSAQAEQRWQRMRKHVDALEEVVGNLEPLLAPRAKAAMGHVARVSETHDDKDKAADTRRTEFENIIEKADAMIRQARIQQDAPKAEYNSPVLTPLLERLRSTISVEDEFRKRCLTHSERLRATSKRMEVVDDMRRAIRHYAQVLDTSVTPDTLWNAYRMDFKGRSKKKEWLAPEEWQANAFVGNMPETVRALRPIVEARAMLKLAKKLEDGAENPEIIAGAVDKFTAKLEPYEQHITRKITPWIQILHSPTSTSKERAGVCNELSSWLKGSAQKVLNNYASPKGSESLQRILTQAYQHDTVAYFKRSPLKEEEQIGLFETPDERAKREAEIEGMKAEDFAKVLDSAPHLRDQINAIRAEVALRSLDGVLERHWRAVEHMYPPSGTGVGMGGRGRSEKPKTGS